MSLSFQTQLVWRNIFLLSLYHVFAFIGLYYLATFSFHPLTFFWAWSHGIMGNLGVIAGAHRLWTHRTYKATLPLKVFLMVCDTVANQNPIYIWARDHRVHHKFTDTDADPHNINRGFFFAHMGWLLCRKHPDVTIKGKTVDMSDLDNDPVVTFQRKYFNYLAPFMSMVVPSIVPWWFWNENLIISFTITMFRYILSLHMTWLVNSVAHMWGYKPYDKNIKAVETAIVSHFTNGEGWHNYHHTFPWDYKAAELGSYYGNLITAFIDLMAFMGLAYDLKVAPMGMVKKVKEKVAMEELAMKKTINGCGTISSQ